MDSDHWQRLKEVLDEVEDLPADQRQDYLYEACAGDADMLRELQSLLIFDDDMEEFIEEPLWSLEGEKSSDKNIGRRIGAYRLERLLGRGGMGAVYLAVREDDFKQRVALKLINPGMYTTEILDRFLNERQILAHLQHPNIAGLLDGGSTEDDLPYFVLEYVEGVPIDEYCAVHKLSVRRRLELFRQVCSAVQTAHQSLVVHRDLKPSNILITPDGVPKLLDFGIAKILSPDLAATGMETEVGRHPMTPNYASPEQITDEVITTASDVYSLGVLLYRLLSLRGPYEVTGAGYSKMIRVICHEEPTKPSTAVTQPRSVLTSMTAPQERLGEPELRRWGRRLAGDLDAIILKAMRKEPQHRYPSVEQLSDDIRRHLSGEAVLARQGTWTYLAGKYVRRHKVGLAVGLLSFFFAVFSTILWRQAVEERTQAVRERNHSQTVVNFLEGLFDAADPTQTQGQEVTVRDILDRGRDHIDEGLAGEVETQADLLRTLGIIYNKLGLYDESRELTQKALNKRRQISSGDDPELATDLANMGNLVYNLGDYKKAEQYYREALAIRRRIGQDELDLAMTMYNLANSLNGTAQYAEAKALQLEILEIRSRHLGERHRDVGVVLHSLGVISYSTFAPEKAESYLYAALDIFSAETGTFDTRVASVLSSLGLVFQDLGRLEEAKKALQQSLQIRQSILGEDHKRVADAKTKLAEVFLKRQEPAKAYELLTQALEVFLQTVPQDHWSFAEARGVMGVYLITVGSYEEAELKLIESYQVIRGRKGLESRYTQKTLERLVALYESWDKPTEAKRYRCLQRKAGRAEPTLLKP
jgi:serine/threonine protein kinase/tetratricopeptide (TPR) repeat protein